MGCCVSNTYGWGTYTLSGNKFEDHNVLHAEESYQGMTSRILMEISNDTLIQRWPVDENWNLPEQYNVEKYVG